MEYQKEAGQARCHEALRGRGRERESWALFHVNCCVLKLREYCEGVKPPSKPSNAEHQRRIHPFQTAGRADGIVSHRVLGQRGLGGVG